MGRGKGKASDKSHLNENWEAEDDNHSMETCVHGGLLYEKGAFFTVEVEKGGDRREQGTPSHAELQGGFLKGLRRVTST